MAANPSLRISICGKECLAEIEPLWKALQEYHIEIGEHLGRMRSPEESWNRRRHHYLDWLESPDSYILLARVDRKAVGYAFVASQQPSAAYRTPEKAAELKTLSVLPQYRGQGVGDALMQELFKVLRRREVSELAIGVFTNNADAIRFYERYGFRPRYTVMWGEIPRY
ncbi:GNAT family N-acetyltransferase [candidate division GN15 bacterium]|nr:GNAT family N-acetyltransferase [candidate division GN15 bacterium]